MRRRLKTDLGEMRNRIVAALRHLLDLLENQVVVVSSERRARRESDDRKKNPSRASFHGEISKRQTANSQTRLDMTRKKAPATVRIMLRFTKMNGAGNDFILIDNRAGDVHLDRSQIAHLCDRHRGVGADGILLLEKASNHPDFRMRYFNADGGEAEMCGNGARCFARFANKVARAQRKISFETPAGVISAELVDDLVTLRMTEPTDLRLDITLPAENENKTVHFINSGVPHVVIPVARIDDVDVHREGSAIRYHKMFSPAGANVNFIEKRGPKKIAVRTYERGVENETLACGTGVVASALIFAHIEKVNGAVAVIARGGDELQVGFQKIDNQFRNVTLTGPAEFVFDGTVEIST
jgi:diaminopimelate epimerase